MNLPLILLILLVLLVVAFLFVVRDAISFDTAKAATALRELFGKKP